MTEEHICCIGFNTGTVLPFYGGVGNSEDRISYATAAGVLPSLVYAEDGWEPDKKFNFCPECGKRLKKEENGEHT